MNNNKSSFSVKPESLGSTSFKKDYNIKYAYLTGAMYKGIASKELIVKLGKAQLLGFLGTGGMRMHQIEDYIQYIQSALKNKETFGVNLLCNLIHPQVEEDTVDLYFKHGVTNVEAAAYMQITPSLVRFRLKGAHRKGDGQIETPNRIIAKVSRPEVATAFMSPAPENILKRLVENGKLTQEEADCGKYIPVSEDICVEADSGGHTDQGIAYTLMPAMITLRNDLLKQYGYAKEIRVGAAGGIGAPESAAAAFIMGADFIMTGSINQCTPEAGMSDVVKDMLQQTNVQDTAYAPAGDMFEIGARVQVLKKGLFFPARANKLYDLYMRYNSIDEIDEKTKKQIQEKYFKRSFDDVWEETRNFYAKSSPEELRRAEQSPKHKMSLIFRWYFVHTTRLAMNGSPEQKVDYQIHCGPAMGSFNQWVKGTPLEDWRNRHVDKIADKLMVETAQLLEKRFQNFTKEN